MKRQMELQAVNQQHSHILDRLIDNIPHAVFWKDENLIFCGCNKNFAVQFGYSDPTELIGKTDLDFPFPPELREKYNYDDKCVINDGISILNYEEIQTQKDGSEKIVLISKVPLYGECNDIIGVLGIYTDITYLKKLEEERQENIVNKKIINKLKIIASSLSHEIRTPLAGLKINLFNLGHVIKKLLLDRSSGKGNDESSVSTQVLKEQSVYIGKMIHRIDSANSLISLQLKNMVTEKIDPDSFQYCSIKDCIEQAIEHFPFEYPQQLQLITYNAQKDFQFFGDVTLTKHIIWNLMNNAFYFIKEVDKGEITIILETDTDKESNILRFRDTARGMSPDEAKRIFERYYTKRTDGNGSGVGLSFCKLVIEAYGGNITCKAELGEFTEFSLSFPKVSNLETLESDDEVILKPDTRLD